MKSFNGLFLWFCCCLESFACFFSQVPIARAQGNTETLTLEVSIPVGAIQWEQSADNVLWEPISGATSEKLELVPKKTTYYRAKIVEVGCAPVFTDVKAAFLEGDRMIRAKLIKGKVNIPENSPLNIMDLSISSFLDEINLKSDGSFELLTLDATSDNILMVVNEDDNVTMLGYYFGNQEEYVVSSETTATALLAMYPLLKPISVEEKRNLIESYRMDIEFTNLIDHVEVGVNNNFDLFSATNQEIRNSIYKIIGNYTDQSRLRVNDFGSNDPILIKNQTENIFTVENKTSHNYIGSVRRKDNNDMVIPLFTVAGSMLSSDSPVTRTIASLLFGKKETESTRSFNLNAYALQPDIYDIRLRSGFSLESDVENVTAMLSNTYVLCSIVIGNLINSAFDMNIFLKDECLAKSIKEAIEYPKIMGTYDGERTNVFADIIKPIFVNITESIVECGDNKPRKSLARIFKLVQLYDEFAPTLNFIIDWKSNREKIDACIILDSENKSSSCYILEQNGIVNQFNDTKNQYYVCSDTLELKIRAVEDKNYYPYKGNPLPNVPFTWFTNNTNNAMFYPENFLWVPGKTDEKGESSIKWIFSAPIQNASAKAVIFLKDTKELSSVEFNASSIIPEVMVDTKGNNQIGESDAVLVMPLQLFFIDKLDKLPMYVDRFDISWEVSGGGTIIVDASSTTAFSAAFSWALGPEDGEQRVNFSIKSRTCDWEIQGNPIIFKATAIDPVVSSIKITPENPKVKKGESVVLTAKAYNAAGREVELESDQWKWEQFDEDFATLEPNGSSATIGGLKPGKVTVMATADEINMSVVLTVTGDPSKIEIVSGNNQFRNTSGYMPKNLKVKVTDDAGNPAEGVSLNWELASGKGRLDDGVTVTDINGLAENKFFVDYSNEKHDVFVSLTNNKEVSALFLETLRLIPIGPNNSWDINGEIYIQGKLNAAFDQRLFNGGSCSKLTYKYPELKDPTISCGSVLSYDISQIDLKGPGPWYTGPDYKNYFKDQDTLFFREVEIPGIGLRRDLEIVTIINDREVMIMRYLPQSYSISKTYIKRGVGWTKVEVFSYADPDPNAPDPNWENPPLVGIPPLPAIRNLFYYKYEFVGAQIED